MINWTRTDPEEFVFLFHSILMEAWGSTIQVIATEDTDGLNPYKFTFRGCREIRWDIIEPDEYDLVTTHVTIIGFDLGDGDYKTEATLHGGFFELVFKYKSLQITKL